MDASEIEACLGKTEDDPAVAQLFATLGMTKRPKLVDFVATIELQPLGLRLALTAEGPKSSRLVLGAITFQSDNEAGYTPFPGALPRGLSFDDSKADVRAKLGRPTAAVDRARLDHWVEGKRRLSVSYRRTEDRIAYVMPSTIDDEG